MLISILIIPTINVYVMNNYFESIFEVIRTGHWITDSVTKLLKNERLFLCQII